MKSEILANAAFTYTAEVRKLDRADCGYSFSIASTWPGARDPTAQRTVVQLTLDAQGLLALRDLISAEVPTWSDLKRSFPYVVVRLMGAVYQKEEISVDKGPEMARIGFRDSFVHHPTPFAEDGALSQGCKTLLKIATLEAVRRTGFRMCIVWGKDDCSFVERDGSIKESVEPPSGGFGSGGVGGTPLPGEIAFDSQTAIAKGQAR